MAKILVVSQSKMTLQIIKEVLPTTLDNMIHTCSSAVSAKRLLSARSFDICIIQPPLQDEQGVRFARELVHRFPIGVLILVKNEQYDPVVYQVKEDGIFVLGLPTSRKTLYQVMQCLESSMNLVRKWDEKAKALKNRIQDDRMVYQAKLILISNYHWSEEKAHHYLEKLAMDTGKKRSRVAKDILEGGIVES